MLRPLVLMRLLLRVGVDGVELSAAASRWKRMGPVCFLGLVALRRAEAEALDRQLSVSDTSESPVCPCRCLAADLVRALFR